ncbi:MAG: sigma factor-like helix-turn-helix DNA-binding protein, partial [Clostridia bacterium]
EAISIDNVEIVDEKEDPLQSLIEKELRFQIENAIETLLSRTEKQVITLFIEGYSYAEIEKATGKSYKAIDGALQRAKKKLSFIKE